VTGCSSSKNINGVKASMAVSKGPGIIAANHNATNGGTELPPGFLAIYSYEEIEAEQD